MDNNNSIYYLFHFYILYFPTILYDVTSLLLNLSIQILEMDVKPLQLEELSTNPEDGKQ